MDSQILGWAFIIVWVQFLWGSWMFLTRKDSLLMNRVLAKAVNTAEGIARSESRQADIAWRELNASPPTIHKALKAMPPPLPENEQKYHRRIMGRIDELCLAGMDSAPAIERVRKETYDLSRYVFMSIVPRRSLTEAGGMGILSFDDKQDAYIIRHEIPTWRIGKWHFFYDKHGET